MKFKNLLKGVALGGIVIGATTMFAGCNMFKEQEKPDETPAYINQTYSTIVSQPAVQLLGANPLVTSSSEDWEKDVVSVKLKEDNIAYLVYDLMAFQGTWTENKETDAMDFDITITDEEDEYVIEMVVDGSSTTIKDKEGSQELIGNAAIELGEKDDVLFDNGLYVGLGSRYKPWNGDDYIYSDEIEEGSYTYKISDNEIYSSDNVCDANKMTVECVGGQLVYTSQYDRAGEDGETNLFFVEKKGEHTTEFVDFFGDLDYVIYSVEDEGGRMNRYYETKATATTTTIDITQNITFNSTKLFKTEWIFDPVEYWTSEYTYENVNMQLEIKTNGTVSLIVTGNEKYNISTTGKWYNIGQKGVQGLLIVLDNKDFFDGYFAIGTYDDDDITIQHLLEDEVTSDINATGDIRYEIGWNDESELEILSREDWILAED